MRNVKIGIVGVCGRGRSFKNVCDQIPGAELHAMCDINERVREDAEAAGVKHWFTDYDTMLNECELDAVVIGTPMHLHAPQTITALNRNLHVLSEVTVGVSVDECRQVVAAAKKTKAIYMMAENYTYMKKCGIVREMVQRGEFGTPYYAEGEYIHELKELNEVTKWRRKWQTGTNGITYGTHSLGPILQWMPGDRVVSVMGAGSGHHYRDPRGAEYENEDSCVMLCKMRGGGLVKIRVDMLSDRPHAMTNYQLQGTDGCFESSRASGQKDLVWLRSRCSGTDEWKDLWDFSQEFTPEMWRVDGEKASKTGHGGGDFFVMLDFVLSIRGEKPCPIGLHESMDMTLPGLISQQSVAEGGRWIDVPDSRDW